MIGSRLNILLLKTFKKIKLHDIMSINQLKPNTVNNNNYVYEEHHNDYQK